jgi:hypothetical protein
MNAPTPNLPAERKPQLMAGAPVAALVPQSLEEAFRLAGALAASGMAPRGIDKPEQIMVAIMAGAELGLAPFQSLQSFAVINGKPSIWGDGMLAVVRARGVKVKEWFDNDDEPTKAFCHVTRPDTGEEIERTFSLSDAKKANLIGKTGPWQTNQKRMLQMRARAFALRDGCADMLRGIQVREEVEDYDHGARTVNAPRASGLRERLSGPSGEGFTSANAPEEPVDFAEQAEEIADAEFSETPEPAPDVNDSAEPPAEEEPPLNDDRHPDSFDVLAWAADIERKLPDHNDVDLLRSDWSAHKADLHAKDPVRFKELNQKIARRAAEIAGAV